MLQGSVLGPLFLLIYINGLPDNIKSTCKIFADDKSLFSPLFNKSFPLNELEIDLQNISNWAYQWKMCFNLDPNKQAQEVYLSSKTNKGDFQNLSFTGYNVEVCSSRKHLGLSMSGA